MFDPIKLGRRIKSLRTQKGLSQDKLAELAELNGKYLGEVERGKANISILNISKLAEVLNVSILNIVDYEHEQDKQEIKRQLLKLIDEASEKELATIYRVVEAIIR